MSDMIKVLFYVRKSKSNSDGLAPIYLRVTVNGKRFEAAIARFVNTHDWSQKNGRSNGNTKQLKELNEFLDVLRNKAFDVQKKLITLGIDVTTEAFSKQWRGVKETPRMLMEIFQRHNDQVKELVGSQYSVSTFTRYK